MRITILAVGKNRTSHLDDAIAEYQKRLNRWAEIDWRYIATSDKDTESLQLLKQLPAESHVLLLDERGKQWSTPELAAQLESWQNTSTKYVVIVIGGAHGVNAQLQERANNVWSLSSLVFPHELVRLILIEQLYRAHDLNHGGSYHHA